MRYKNKKFILKPVKSSDDIPANLRYLRLAVNLTAVNYLNNLHS